MAKYYNEDSYATDPGGVSLNPAMLRSLHLSNGGIVTRLVWSLGLRRRWQTIVTEQLALGDSRAALVVQIFPFPVVAAYTSDMDCVAMLGFHRDIAEEHAWSVGTRLLTVNMYSEGGKLASDLIEGSGSDGVYKNFRPAIADVLSRMVGRIEFRKQQIDESEWARVEELARARLPITTRDQCRDGSSIRSFWPAFKPT